MADITLTSTCPQCGGPDLVELAWNRRRCNHCGAESILSDDHTHLEIIGWECPQCGFNNEPNTTFCGKCRAVLAKVCPQCLNVLRHDLTFCSKCGANYETERTALYQALERGQVSEHSLQYLEAALRLNPADTEALCWQGQVYIQASQWHPALTVWNEVYRSTPQDPLLLRMLTQFTDAHLGLLKKPGLADARLTDEQSRRYLQIIRSSAPQPPAPLGRTSMDLLRRISPAKAQRMEEMYQAAHSEFTIRQRTFEQTQGDVFSDRMTLARMCVAALEEDAERQRSGGEQAGQGEAQFTVQRAVQENVVVIQVQPKKRK